MKAISNSSNVGDVVLELFGGSGSTLIEESRLEECLITWNLTMCMHK